MRFGRRQGAVEPADVLVVCTGNICRSPYIALTLAARHPELTVRSAGTSAMVGEPPSGPTQELLAAAGITAEHRARQVTAGMVSGAGLVIAATGTHRGYLVSLEPGAVQRVYTLRELARLVDGVPPSGGLAGLVAAAQERLAAQTLESPDDDLADPWMRPVEEYDEMAATVEAALAVIEPWLA